MRLSLSWIITLILIAYSVFFFLYGWKVYETFTNKEISEGFQGEESDISMTSCPPSSDPDEATPMKAQISPGTTQTWCLDIDGTKKCSLSVSPKDPSSCSHYYKALLRSKATTRCPASMPNYFQDLKFSNNVDSSVRGCTSGARTPDGKSPASGGKHCTIYTSQKDDVEQLDSCTNRKRLETAQCFSSTVAGVKTELKPNTYGSPYIQCTFSQIEQVQTGTNTVDTNAEANAAQEKQIAADKAVNSKWADARNVVASLATQGPVRVLSPFSSECSAIIMASNKTQEAINISQLVIRDTNGTNITARGRLDVSSEDYATHKQTVIDGTEFPRAYPNIYHSKIGGGQWIRIEYPSPVTVSSISIFNRSDCCNDRIAGYDVYILQSNGLWVTVSPLTADLVQTFSFIPPIASYSGERSKPNLVTTNIFSPESVTHTCTELQSYRSWIDSIRTLYPEMYASSSYNLDSSETWSDDKKNSFCNILEQTKIKKSMSASALKTAAVL